MDHRVLERFQEIFLELEMRQLVLLQEPHSELTQSIQREKANVWVVVATDLEPNGPKEGSIDVSS